MVEEQQQQQHSCVCVRACVSALNIADAGRQTSSEVFLFRCVILRGSQTWKLSGRCNFYFLPTPNVFKYHVTTGNQTVGGAEGTRVEGQL